VQYKKEILEAFKGNVKGYFTSYEYQFLIENKRE